MSIHSLAKELGVSEYALRQYAKEHMPKSKNTRDSYKFTQQDLKLIKLKYSDKKNPELIMLMFRIYDKNRNHLYLPAGIIPKKDEEIVKAFVEMQYSTANVFGEKCHNFFICSQRQVNTRLEKLKEILGYNLYVSSLEELTKKFLTTEKIKECVEKKIFISYKDFVPKSIRDFLYNRDTTKSVKEVSLDDYYEKILSESIDPDDFSDKDDFYN